MRNLFVVALVAGTLSLSLYPASPVWSAEGELRTVKVGVIEAAPFVIVLDDDHYSGLAWELWESIAQGLALHSEYVFYPSFVELLYAARNGDVDFIVTNLTVNYERSKYLQFSFPWFDDGLRILVNSEVRRDSVWSVLWQRGQLGVYFWIILIFFVLALVQVLLRRRLDEEFPQSWREGISLSLHEVVRSAKAGVPQKNVLGWIGHVFMALWMIFGFGLLAYVTSTLTCAMTTSASYSHVAINSLNDLPGKRVGVLSHTVAETYMRARGTRLHVYDTTDAAVAALIGDELDALVMDAAELEYMVHNNPKMRIMVVGNSFHPQRYAFAAAKNNADADHLMGAISEELLRLIDNGAVKELENKYIGNARF